MNYSLVTTSSTFPPTSRPIYVHPIAEMTRKNKDAAYPLVSSAIAKVAALHPTDRILVHTVSYDLTKYLQDNLQPDVRHRLVAYHNAIDRGRSLQEYLDKPGSILLASSFDRGVDLPGDDCRAIVVAKVPYPNLGDNQVSARLHQPGGQLWYSVQTVRSLVQMTGRGMRSASDSCSSYILDKQFVTSIYKKNQRLLPKWWSEALVWNAGKL